MASISSILSTFPSPCTLPHFKKSCVANPFRCCSGPSHFDSESSEKGSSLLGISTNSWRTWIGALGFVETGYLSFLKLTDTEAFCAVGGGGCSDVLNSDYSYVFGIPLSVFGMVAYGLVALLSLQQNKKNLNSVVGETDTQLILLGTTTSMAAASAYFLYLLSTKLAGSSCPYCLLSATLSFSLFFITIKDVGLENFQKVVGIQLAVAGIVVAVLGNSYMTIPQSSSASDITLDLFETEITNQSTPWALSLAKHLRSVGAKMYGAFWCSHCNEQKQMFGREAAKELDYIECFPEGAGKGRKMAKVCADAAIEGFPTWIIQDKVLSGEQELKDLAEISGFPVEDSGPS